MEKTEMSNYDLALSIISSETWDGNYDNAGDLMNDCTRQQLLDLYDQMEDAEYET